MLPMKIKKVSLFHIPSTGHYQFPPLFQPKRKNEKKDTHIGARKSKHRKKTEAKLKESKLGLKFAKKKSDIVF